ncbi:EscU/YscU/HrcU family type III secretion system export apparatus switch protein [Alsobacter sp. KACC 23698]|uniref:EscU/YscU/HrcU family type III secretion system export apparatus switch protein n=1 Tax=Alsobacter sp. KACC 23698 TaxID=3149229 RepID=A0AAU7JKW7_9HYPH
MTSVSPRKLAVALEYRKGEQRAPRVTATGRGAVAERIVAAAEEHGVAIEENPALAEALSKVPLDDEIPEALYRAVAEVLTFVLRATLSGRRG